MTKSKPHGSIDDGSATLGAVGLWMGDHLNVTSTVVLLKA